MNTRISTTKRVSPIIVLPMIGAIFAFIALVLLIVSNNTQRRAEAAQAWPAANGTIVKTWVEENIEREDDGTIERDYTPEVQYEYIANDRIYRSQQRSFGFQPVFRSSQSAEQVLENYPVGKQVTVFYNPEAPAEAVLNREIPANTVAVLIGWVFLILGIVFILVPAGLFILGRSRRKGMGAEASGEPMESSDQTWNLQ
jgi:hypothetical protein